MKGDDALLELPTFNDENLVSFGKTSITSQNFRLLLKFCRGVNEFHEQLSAVVKEYVNDGTKEYLIHDLVETAARIFDEDYFRFQRSFWCVSLPFSCSVPFIGACPISLIGVWLWIKKHELVKPPYRKRLPWINHAVFDPLTIHLEVFVNKKTSAFAFIEKNKLRIRT